MRIYKYPLQITDFQSLDIPGFVSVLSVIVQYDQLMLYVVVDPDNEVYTAVRVAIVGTGNDFYLNTGWIFLGTHNVAHDGLIWHVWWDYEKNQIIKGKE